MITRLRATVTRYTQPPLDYCTHCAGHFPPSHFPCT
ncbi:hypothetical protein SZN_09321 [Streptomyces zinciresistens K42]|uniref:Uncharacterized protein n=1 Tax=Streptomyces zinciresistens K42 TaxID=700597 RepID=G2G8P6_9ACTN|nr:hypothetical protein SZN_09321 [Streptomyces zinciresistens K42]